MRSLTIFFSHKHARCAGCFSFDVINLKQDFLMGCLIQCSITIQYLVKIADS